jgi:ribonuclease HII
MTPRLIRADAPLPAIDRSRLVVAGVDEVGRGPLAGPVVVAAVVLDPGRPIVGLADSKALTPARRAELATTILSEARAVAFASASPASIDRLNIRAATLKAMAQAVSALSVRPDHVLVDGRDALSLCCPSTAVIGGDARVPDIAAASIVAKVMRDALMARLDLACPGYGFARHAGYGVPAHLEALRRLGPCPAHRMSFAPVRAARLPD